MLESSRAIVIRYYPSGQFTFRHFEAGATDAQLFDLATQLNSLQSDDAHKILKVVTSRF